MKKTKRIYLALLAVLLSPMAANADYVYVGSWIVGDGPVWTSNPDVYSGQDAAAFLFGGLASDYAISTIDSSVANINFLTFLDGYGDLSLLASPAAQNYSLSSNGGGYDAYPSFSAYVLDHTCGNRYSDPSAGCSGDGTQYVNYAFRMEVPEPGTLALLGLGLAGMGMTRRKKKV